MPLFAIICLGLFCCEGAADLWGRTWEGKQQPGFAVGFSCSVTVQPNTHRHNKAACYINPQRVSVFNRPDCCSQLRSRGWELARLDAPHGSKKNCFIWTWNVTARSETEEYLVSRKCRRSKSSQLSPDNRTFVLSWEEEAAFKKQSAVFLSLYLSGRDLHEHRKSSPAH